jgi:hypothetical protein
VSPELSHERKIDAENYLLTQAENLTRCAASVKHVRRARRTGLNGVLISRRGPRETRVTAGRSAAPEGRDKGS